MKLLNLSILFLTFLLLSSCGTIKNWFDGTTKRVISIQTTPGNVEVAIYNPKSTKYEVLGKTPLEVNIDDLISKNKTPKAVSFMLSRKGYVKENLLVQLRGYSKLSYAVKMDEVKWWIDPTDENASHIVHYIGTSVKELYSLIRVKKLETAMDKVDKLLEQFPAIPIFHDIKGSIYLLNGEKQKAVTQYQRSLQLRPDNIETLKKLKDLNASIPLKRGKRKL